MLAYIYIHMDPIWFAKNELVNGVFFNQRSHHWAPKKAAFLKPASPGWDCQNRLKFTGFSLGFSTEIFSIQTDRFQNHPRSMSRNRVILNLFYHSICLQVTQTQIGNKQTGYKLDQKCICLEVTIWMIKVHISLFLNSQSQPFRFSNAAVEAWTKTPNSWKVAGPQFVFAGFSLLQNVLQCVLQSKQLYPDISQ